MRATDLAQALGAKRSGRQFVCKCPAHEDSQPSLTFWDGHTAIRFKCWSGCEPEDVIAALRHNGIVPRTNRARQNGATKVARPHAQEPNGNVQASSPSVHGRFAGQIWREAKRVSGIALDYLAGRDLVLPPELDEAVVRFHPSCPRGAERVPALVVLMRGLSDDKPRAIQRIFLNRDGRKDGKPMMLGPAGDAAMKLAPLGPRLTVCEGFETGLQLLAEFYEGVWALGSAGAIARFTPAKLGAYALDELVVAADHDDVGINAFNDCEQHWGGRARGVMVNGVGMDFADRARRKA